MRAESITSWAMSPNSSRRMCSRRRRASAIRARAASSAAYSSCLAADRAFSGSRRPRYWATTTAPPVDRAEKILMIRMLILSTRDTPDTTDSPALVTIMVSAMPTVIRSSCSTTRGIMSRTRSWLENMGFWALTVVSMTHLSL